MFIKRCRQLGAQSERITLSIVANGNAFCGTDWRAFELTPPYSRLYYILDGTAEIETEQGTLPLTAGHIYLLPAGYSFSYRCSSNMQQLFFHIKLTNNYGADVLWGIQRILLKEVPASYTETLLDLFEQDSRLSREYLKALLLTDVLSLLQEHQIPIKSKQYSQTVQQALLYIEKNLSSALTVKKIADAIRVSPPTLSHRFKDELGISIGKYIDGLVIHQAESLLLSTGLPLSQISETLGFCDQFYFSRRFKEAYGVTPFEYRKTHHAAP